MRPNARAAVLGVYDEQEAQIRELADLLQAVLDNSAPCSFRKGTCLAHDWVEQKFEACVYDEAASVLARARGAS